MKSTFYYAMILAVGLAFTSCDDAKKKEQAEAEKMEMEKKAQEEKEAMEAEAEAKKAEEFKANSVVGVAMGSEDHTTLVSAVKAAGLVEMLQGEGPYTVFAPTNAAFEKLPEGTLASLLEEDNKDALKGILSYHVVPAKVMAADLTAAIESNNGKYEVEAAGGGKFTAMVKDGKVMIKDGKGNTATVVATDLDASNGVVHVIDKVLMKE
ncbi:hypothetical protein GCM10009117_23150 [Gangjinia marincola]|uniref:FAS1 domain-containing protein n=1 Tax=Gangjinia marincola TaxID=578463 RepID=A0ABN1MJ30_9FLAO